MTPQPASMMKMPLSDAYEVSVVGSPPMTLWGEYDERQAWLPFVRALLFCKKPKAAQAPQPAPSKHKKGAPKRRVSSGESLSRNWKDKMIQPSANGGMRLYHHEPGVDQPVLPFHAFRKISTKEYKRLIVCEFPGFERMTKSDGTSHIASISFMRKHQEFLTDWAHENAVGRYHITVGFAVFEKVSDAVMAKLSIPI